MIEEIIGGIIGLIILIYGLNWWKYRHLFEVDLEKDMPFTFEWISKSQGERDKIWAEMVERGKAEWKERYDTMTDEEIEEKYCCITQYANEEIREKRKAEEKIILDKRGECNE